MILNTVLLPTRWPIFATLGSAIILAGAFGFEHLGGLPPCPLCISQRWAHVIIIVIGVVSVLAIQLNSQARQAARLFNWLLGMAFLYSVYRAFNHAGIEYGWWAGPASCTSSGEVSLDLNSLNATLGQATNVVLCDEIAWQMLGISMAGWNGILSLVLAGLCFAVAFQEPQS